jgi:hypothetical protein
MNVSQKGKKNGERWGVILGYTDSIVVVELTVRTFNLLALSIRMGITCVYEFNITHTVIKMNVSPNENHDIWGVIL